MSRAGYAPVGPPPSYPPRPAAAASSTHASPSRRTTASSNSTSRRQDEVEASFADSDDSDNDDGENIPLSQTRRNVVWDAGEDAGLPDEDRPLAAAPSADGVDDPLRRSTPTSNQQHQPSYRQTDAEPTYDFDRDYFLPPPGSPPPGAYPENYLPTGPTPLTTTPTYPSAPSAPSRFLRSLLPTHFTRSAAPTPRGSDGVFANITAKPELEGHASSGGVGVDGDNTSVMAEFSSKDAPPAYNVAARDAVPPYWEHNVVAPSFGPLGSITGSGDDLLIDGLPVGNFFGFVWNLLVSMSFQFVGFLLTYVLHTTHSAKYGSRAGLGVTLIQYGFYLRSRAEEILETGVIDPDGDGGGGFGGGFGGLFGGGGGGGMGEDFDGATSSIATATTSTISSALATATATLGAPISIPTFTSNAEAYAWASAHPNEWAQYQQQMGMPSPEEVGAANEWLSFVLMCVGWFILITSLLGYWRVKRYERSLLAAQEADDDAASVPAPGISFTAIRDWYRTRSVPFSSSGAQPTYPGADLHADDGPSPSSADISGGQPQQARENPFRALGRSVRDWRTQLLDRAQAIREFRARQWERERREEEGQFML